GAVISDDTGAATIVNDDAASYLSINDKSIAEGNSGTKTVTFTITRAGSAAAAASVNWATINSSATAPSDYVAVPPTALAFAAGERTKTVSVTVNGDSILEGDEAFLVRLSAPVGAALSDDTGVATITNDDAQGYFSISDVSIPEGDSGLSTAIFTITRSGNVSGPASVNYLTNNGSAAA